MVRSLNGLSTSSVRSLNGLNVDTITADLPVLITNRNITLKGLNGLGTAGQIIKVNSGGTELEYANETDTLYYAQTPLVLFGSRPNTPPTFGLSTLSGYGNSGQIITSSGTALTYSNECKLSQILTTNANVLEGNRFYDYTTATNLIQIGNSTDTIKFFNGNAFSITLPSPSSNSTLVIADSVGKATITTIACDRFNNSNSNAIMLYNAGTDLLTIGNNAIVNLQFNQKAGDGDPQTFTLPTTGTGGVIQVGNPIGIAPIVSDSNGISYDINSAVAGSQNDIVNGTLFNVGVPISTFIVNRKITALFLQNYITQQALSFGTNSNTTGTRTFGYLTNPSIINCSTLNINSTDDITIFGAPATAFNNNGTAGFSKRLYSYNRGLYLYQNPWGGSGQFGPGRASWLITPGFQQFRLEFHLTSTDGTLIWLSYINGVGVYVVEYSFTGQHKSKSINDNIYNNIEDYVGLICYATGEYATYDFDNETCNSDSQGITINDSMPIIDLCNTKKDKRVYGVISNKEDTDREMGYGRFVSKLPNANDVNRVVVNGIGEGAIWIVNTNGNLENGDYIQTSNVAGYGEKQDSEFLANYTVAKITCDCDFNMLSNKYRSKMVGDNIACFVGCVYYCG